LLATEFLARFSSQNGKQITDFDAAAWDWILSYSWPGNVRELKNAVERAVIMARGELITVNDVMPRHLRNAGEVPASVTIHVGASMSDARRQLVLRTFASTSGDAERAAKLLGMSADDVRKELMLVLENGHGGGSPATAESRPVKAAPAPEAPTTPAAARKTTRKR
jgi:DNA-binding NtrC family response regulator